MKDESLEKDAALCNSFFKFDLLSFDVLTEQIKQFCEKHSVYERLYIWERDLKLQDLYIEYESTLKEGIISFDVVFEKPLFPDDTKKYIEVEQGSTVAHMVSQVLLHHFVEQGYE